MPRAIVENKSHLLAGWERWLYGGAGSLAPTIISATTVDFAIVFASITTPVFLGWSVRVMLLFIIGGFVTFLHRNETDHWRAFVIGISAPTLITTYLAGV